MKFTAFALMMVVANFWDCFQLSSAACSARIGCPAGRNAGQTWSENCQTCKCEGSIEVLPPVLCFLPSAKPLMIVINLPIYTVPFVADESFDVDKFSCPLGFVSEEMMMNNGIAAVMALSFEGRRGGQTSCCSDVSKPTWSHKACNAIFDANTCTYQAVLAADTNIRCLYAPDGFVM